MIQLVPRVSRDTRTAKKAVSRLGGYAAPNFRFFAILMHARDRSISGERAEQRAVSLLGSLQRNRAAGPLGRHGSSTARPSMASEVDDNGFCPAADKECAEDKRSPSGDSYTVTSRGAKPVGLVQA